MNKNDVSENPCFKAFFVDVGQGDGALIEAPNGRILIDGGPTSGYGNFLKYLYKPTIEREGSVHFDAVVMSHPDADHFHGLTSVLKNREFTFGTIYHNGIMRYYGSSPAGAEFDLGNIFRASDGRILLSDTASSLRQIEDRIDRGGVMSQFTGFWKAAIKAKEEGRLEGARRVTSRDRYLPGFSSGGTEKLRVRVLGPIPTRPSGRVYYPTFPDPHDYPSVTPSSSHTRNGHSIILRLEYGAHSFLFGGDLNIPAQKYLLEKMPNPELLNVDVAKACHHGSSDFLVNYLKKVNPQVNVFSSGDNKSFDHPMPDSLGAVGKYSRGEIPLLFSTELARATGSRGTHYGLINARSNGSVLTMAQMKEQKNRADIWDSFTVPWPGRFAH